MCKRIILTILLAVAGVLVLGCGEADKNNAPPRLVKVFVVGQSANPQLPEISKSKGELSFDASGKVIEVLASPGAKVVAGQTLARIIPTSMAMSESSSLISYRAARAELQSAELDFKSYTDLRQKNFISASEYERRVSMVEGARARYEQTLDQLGFISLRARLSGQLMEFKVALNQLVTSGEIVGFIKANEVPILQIPKNQALDVINIPTTAITSDGSSVLKVKLASGSRDVGVLEMASIQTQRSNETWTVVDKGLSQGDLIVAVGWHVLSPGQKVRITLIDKGNE